jgi:hypothetical protein
MGLNQPERENEKRSYARQFFLHCTDELAKGATGEERIQASSENGTNGCVIDKVTHDGVGLVSRGREL